MVLPYNEREGRKYHSLRKCLLYPTYRYKEPIVAMAIQCGVTPFKGQDKKETFRLILYRSVSFPPDIEVCSFNVATLVLCVGNKNVGLSISNVQISKPCKSLINKLLEKESHKRLGSTHGAADLKNHPFFSSINWPRMSGAAHSECVLELP